jgi:two-component system, NarL family, sensor kinase
MRLRLKVLLVATVPLVLAIVGVVAVVMMQSENLERSQIAAVQPILLQARKDELQHFVQAGHRSIAHLFETGSRDPALQREALEALRRMDFGPDNYFYVYDLNGMSLMHPRLPEFEGTSRWTQRDGAGSLIVQRLIVQARSGGGFFDFQWLRPSTGRIEAKIGYVELVPQWGWVIGSGLYLDELQLTQAMIRKSTEDGVSATRNQILLIALVALVAVGTGGFALNLYEQRAADTKLRAMAQQVVLSREAERKHVARELHDGVVQSLAAVKFVFESALVQFEHHSSDTAGTLRNGLNQMRGVMRDVRKMSHTLRPMLLDEVGISSAISQIAREFTDRTGVQVHTQIDEVPQMPDAVATACFRVAQEALGNVERHAGAEHVSLRLQHVEDGLQLHIRDDGRGFDVHGKVKQIREGLGLTSMRERIEMLGGHFDLRSTPGETSLTATLPSEALRC